MSPNGANSDETPLVSEAIIKAVKAEIFDYSQSQLATLSAGTGNYAIKFVNSQWAVKYYQKWAPLFISATPALTWGTAAYVTPLLFPLSSALYGRIGLVTEYKPDDWKIFDATRPTAQAAYTNWVKAQPSFRELVLTVHSTYANHFMRDQFRRTFQIDCVLFHPDQAAELYTDVGEHVWMAVTDWARVRKKRTKDKAPAQPVSRESNTWRREPKIKTGFSPRLRKARFTVLVDEDFSLLEKYGLPIHQAERRIEQVTETISLKRAMRVSTARVNPKLHATIASFYKQKGYVHIFIEP